MSWLCLVMFPFTMTCDYFCNNQFYSQLVKNRWLSRAPSCPDAQGTLWHRRPLNKPSLSHLWCTKAEAQSWCTKSTVRLQPSPPISFYSQSIYSLYIDVMIIHINQKCSIYSNCAVICYYGFCLGQIPHFPLRFTCWIAPTSLPHPALRFTLGLSKRPVFPCLSPPPSFSVGFSAIPYPPLHLQLLQ